jgi:hypothetical protein
MIGGGLILKEKDIRNFHLGAIVDLPPVSETPQEFQFETLEVKNQLDSDCCAAMSSTTASELQEGVLLSPEFVFAAGKEISGDLEGFGLTIYDVLKAHTKVGAIEKKNAPFSLENKSRDFIADIKNWPTESKLMAAFHKKKTYWEITGKQKITDDIRSALWYFREEKRAVIIGVVWSWNLTDLKIDTISDSGTGHAMVITGYKHIDGELYFIVQNSYSISAGYNGIHYFHWRVIEYFSKLYGCFMFIDLSREEAEMYLDTGVKLKDFWFVKIIKAILKFLGLR